MCMQELQNNKSQIRSKKQKSKLELIKILNQYFFLMKSIQTTIYQDFSKKFSLIEELRVNKSLNKSSYQQPAIPINSRKTKNKLTLQVLSNPSLIKKINSSCIVLNLCRSQCSTVFKITILLKRLILNSILEKSFNVNNFFLKSKLYIFWLLVYIVVKGS